MKSILKHGFSAMVSLSFLFLAYGSGEDKSNETQSNFNTSEVDLSELFSDEEKDYPYIFIDKKAENGSNTMQLYVVNAPINQDSLKRFCALKKNNIKKGHFHYIVFFDSEKHAMFPNNPLTAFYGMDESPQRHIKAYYEYNRLNGFSELKVYNSNSWEGSADLIRIN